LLLVGFVGLFFGVGETVFLVNLTDSILSEWNRFTLSNKETSHVHLQGVGIIMSLSWQQSF